MNILQMSVSAGLLVIAVVSIRALALDRLPKTMFLALWGVVLLRLLIPVYIPSQYSVYSIFGGLFSGDSPADPVSETVLLPIDGGMAGQNLPTPDVWAAARDLPTAREQAKTMSIAPITAIWVAGMIAAGIFFAVVYFKNRRALRFTSIIGENDFLDEWLAEHRLLRPVAIAQSDRVTTPLAVGLVKPRIILPKSMDMDDRQLLGYVLAHEYCHIKRCDALWKMLLVLALCVHWFNPMVWAMFVLANRDLELTCDAMVLRRFGAETRTAYAYTLISMAEQRSRFAPLHIGYSRNATEERIVSIMKNKKASLLASILAIALVSVLTVGVLAASGAGAQSDGKNPVAPSGYVPPITLDDLTGERIDHVGVLANEALANEMNDVQSLFISEVLHQYRDNLNGLILCNLYKGTQYGDLWSVSAVSKERTSAYTCVIDRGTMNVLELRRDETGSYMTMDESIALGQRHDGNDAKAMIAFDGSGVIPSDEQADGSSRYIAEGGFSIVNPIPLEMPEIVANDDSEAVYYAGIFAHETRDEILKRFPEIKPEVLDVVFSRQLNGNVTRLLSVHPDDERKFSKDDWQAILEAIELGIVYWETDAGSKQSNMSFFSDVRNEKHDDGSGYEIVAAEKPAAPQIPLMTPGKDSARLAFSEGKEWVIDIGYQYAEQRITVFIDSAYDNDFIVGVKSITTGELYSQNLTGSGIVSVLVPKYDDYAIYIKNILGQARVALSYAIN